MSIGERPGGHEVKMIADAADKHGIARWEQAAKMLDAQQAVAGLNLSSHMVAPDTASPSLAGIRGKGMGIS